MTNRFISDLQAAADRCGDSDIAALLRRAALKIGNLEALPLDDDVEGLIEVFAMQERMSKNDVIRRMLREHLEGMGLLPLHDLDEDGPVEGNA